MSNEDFQKLVLENFKEIKENITGIKTQLDENTNIVRALMHSAEVNKADHDKMELDMAKMQGSITSLQKDSESIKDVLNLVEQVTAKNWVDLTKIKKAQ